MNAWKRLDERLSAGKGRTLWQFVKFNLVSLTVTILQLLLANLLPLAFDRVVSPLPPLLRGNLRRGDVISRCSVSQFVIMLPQANYENSCMVAERLTGAFYRRYPHSSARLRCMVQPLIPNE